MSDPSALLRLAQIQRVQKHRRTSMAGNTVNVQSYLRKVLDAFGSGADSDTKRAAFVDRFKAIRAEKGEDAALDFVKTNHPQQHEAATAGAASKAAKTAAPSASKLPSDVPAKTPSGGNHPYPLNREAFDLGKKHGSEGTYSVSRLKTAEEQYWYGQGRAITATDTKPPSREATRRADRQRKEQLAEDLRLVRKANQLGRGETLSSEDLWSIAQAPRSSKITNQDRDLAEGALRRLREKTRTPDEPAEAEITRRMDQIADRNTKIKPGDGVTRQDFLSAPAGSVITNLRGDFRRGDDNYWYKLDSNGQPERDPISTVLLRSPDAGDSTFKSIGGRDSNTKPATGNGFSAPGSARADGAQAKLQSAYLAAQREVDKRLGYSNPNAMPISLRAIMAALEKAGDDDSIEDVVKKTFSGRLQGTVLKVLRQREKAGGTVKASDERLDALHLSAVEKLEVRLSGITDDDLNLITLGSRASLDRSPKKNWVENSGELPPYVREVARSIEKTGKTLSASIAIALSRLKVWAVKGEPDTKAKAIEALAQWEALKAKNRARKAAK